MNENQKFRSLMNIDANKLHQMEQERKAKEELELQKQQLEQNNVEIETEFNQNNFNSNDENQMNIVDIPTDIEEKQEENIIPVENIDNNINNVIEENSNETNVNENIHQVEEIREENNFVPINNINTNNTMNMTQQITNNVFTFVGTSKNRYIIFSKFIRYIIFINRYKYSNS